MFQVKVKYVINFQSIGNSILTNRCIRNESQNGLTGDKNVTVLDVNIQCPVYSISCILWILYNTLSGKQEDNKKTNAVYWQPYTLNGYIRNEWQNGLTGNKNVSILGVNLWYSVSNNCIVYQCVSGIDVRYTTLNLT